MSAGEESDERVLAAHVAEALGVSEVRLVGAVEGGSRAAFRVETPANRRAAFLRVDDGEGGMSGTPFDLQREAAILGRVREAGIPVPRVLASFDDPSATLLEYVEGSSRMTAREADQVGPEYMRWIAETHRVEPSTVPVERYETMAAAVAADLTWWTDRAGRDGLGRHPLIGLAARVLAGSVPTVDRPPCFVHGDAGPGNLLIHGGRVAAVLDWELAHLGDPHEDLAWLWMRGAHSEFGDPRRRFAEYQRAGGAAVDEARLRWHLAFVMYKTVIAIRSRLQRPGGRRLVVTQYVLLVTYEALLGWALARLCGVHLPLLTGQPVEQVTPEVRLVERLEVAFDADDGETAAVLDHLRLAAAQRAWRTEALDEAIGSATGGPHGDLSEVIDGADRGDLVALVRAIAGDADRACWALPPALRRVRRAQAIGLGT